MTHRVLSTKIISDKEIAYAAAAGIELDCAEVISTEAIFTDVDVQIIKSASSDARNVIITSSKSVEILKNILPNPPQQWRIACIDGKTSEAVAEWLGENAIVAQGIDAKRLLIALEEECPENWLFFCGKQRLPAIPTGMKALGKCLTECVLYDTFALSPALPGYFNGYLFYSPSGVRSFFKKNTVAAGAVIIAIGYTTAKVVYEYSGNELLIADQPTPHTMIDTLKKYYATK